MEKRGGSDDKAVEKPMAVFSYTESSNDPQLRSEAGKIAELGTYALIGDHKSSQKLQAELLELEQDPEHLQLVARELTSIRTVGKDSLPVQASFVTDGAGNVTSLKFNSSDELERIAYAKEHEYQVCMHGAASKHQCSDLDTPANGITQIAPVEEVAVLLSEEQKVLKALKSAIASGNEAEIANIINPFLGKNPDALLRITGAEQSVRPTSYSVDHDKLTRIYFPKPGSSQYLQFGEGSSSD